MAYKGKYAKPSDSFGYGVIRTLFILVCLLVLSFHMMSGLLAKYNAIGSGSDDARVAAFHVVVSGTPQESDIVCTSVDNGNGTYTITIQNNSEVAVHYDLSLTITGNATGVRYDFSPESGDLAVGDTGTSALTFTVNWNDFTADKTGAKAEVTLAFTVTVNVTQID